MTSRALATASPAFTVPAAVSTIQAVQAQSFLFGEFKAFLYVQCLKLFTLINAMIFATVLTDTWSVTRESVATAPSSQI